MRRLAPYAIAVRGVIGITAAIGLITSRASVQGLSALYLLVLWLAARPIRAAVAEDLAINNRALNAIDSGIDAQAVLDASFKNYLDKIAPIVSQIVSG